MSPFLVLRRLGAAALVTAAHPAVSQAWEPTSAADPWGPYGSQTCSGAVGDPERFCMAVFCTGPDAPLAFGYSNAAHGGAGQQDVILSVNGLQSWTMELTLQPGFGHLVGTAALDPGRYPGLYQSIRAGSRLSLDDQGGWVFGLPLTGSDGELQRLSEVCAPVRPLALNEIEITLIGPRRADGPPQIEAIVAPDPDGPTTLDELNALRDTEVGSQTRPPASDTTATTAPQPEPPGTGPAIPAVPAPVVGAADWQSIPPMGETVYGTRLCFPEVRGGPADRCLNLGCFEDWRRLNILYEDAAFPAGDWRGSADFAILLSDAAGRAARLPLLVNPDAESLVAAGLAQDMDWTAALALLNRDGPLRIDTPYGAATVMAGNSGPEIDRMLADCDTP